MKRFIFRTLIFALIVLASLAGIEMAVRHFSPNPYRDKHQWLMEHGASVTTLVLGNSHPFYGFRADLWPGGGAFNLANVSQTLDYDLALLRHYLPLMPNLRTVILEASVCSLLDNRLEDSAEAYRATNYQIYMHLGLHPFDPRYNLEMATMSIFGQKVGNFAGLGKPGLRCDSLGNGLGYDASRRWRSVDASGPKIAEFHRSSLNPSRLAANLATLRQIISLCRSRGITPVIYTQPAWPTYRANLPPEMTRTVFDSLAALAAGERVSWINLFDDPAFTEADFFDADHLTHTPGAVKLTSALARARAR